MREIFNIRASLTSMLRIVAMVLMMLTLTTSCTKDSTGPEINNGGYTEGVMLPTETKKQCGMGATTIDIPLTTADGYSVDTDNADMISFTAGASATAAGKYTLKIAVKANNNKSVRSGNVFITVNGYKRTKLLTIEQAALNIHPLVEWIDQRLSTEYYWLDEYCEKRPTFDFTLPYDKFLETSLLSLTTNLDDGRVYSDGTRSLYSYIMEINPANMDGDGNQREETMGFGLSLSTSLMLYTESTVCIGIDHVYPGSSAADAGLKRGDIVVKIDNEPLPRNDIGRVNELFQMIQYNSESEATIEYLQVVGDKFVTKQATLTAGYFIENPVAFCDVLTLPKEWYDNGIADKSRKVGYISYMSFDFNHEKRLVNAISELSRKGITDLIVDLRINHGGDTRSCTSLASMIVSESYVGEPVTQFTFNPKRNKEPELDYIRKNGYEEMQMAMTDLPNLNMERVYFITSSSSSSASELLIVGLMGLGIDVVMIGTTTDGKNCGMEAQTVKLTSGSNESYYIFAPITFMTANGQGFHDYGDGITPGEIGEGTDFDKYADNPNIAEDIQHSCSYFPIPEAEWGDVGYDFALAESVAQIFGKTFITPASSTQAYSSLIAGSQYKSLTRGSDKFKPLDIKLEHRNGGNTIPADEPVKVLAK